MFRGVLQRLQRETTIPQGPCREAPADTPHILTAVERATPTFVEQTMGKFQHHLQSSRTHRQKHTIISLESRTPISAITQLTIIDESDVWLTSLAYYNCISSIGKH